MFPGKGGIRMKFNDSPASLLIRATNWLGDAVMTTPALAGVRAAFPGTRIVLLAKPPVAELFRHHPDLDEVMVYERPGRHEGAVGRFRLGAELRRLRFDGALLLQNAFDAALVAFLARIPERAGYPTDGRRMLLSLPVPLTRDILERHEVEYYLCLLDGLGVPRPAMPVLNLHVTEGEREAMATRLASLGIERGSPFLVVNPGATYGSAKRWYPDRFAAVADALSEEWGSPVVVMGSPAEAPLAGEIEAAALRGVLNLAGKTTVREMMALLSLSSFLVTNDSGPMHVGAALGVPLVAIFGPTDWRRTSPWTDRARVVRVDVDCSPCMLRACDRGHECMLGVTAGMVIAAAREFLPNGVRAGA
ncbi:MAG TPA: lipopolysaccharide heptosyltransferase II [Deltaproteobacteria bacterium]|nr:lipopolysaccharide heptosyltransferase II [Deltaproteobacteria bacterium]HBG73459.1 lipopolysaccharide heptosyltransferase II [Deltaproteobacteria bacterium]